MAMAMERAGMQQRAISKALAMGGAQTVERVRYGTYRVASRTRAQLAHTVSVVEGTYWCTCEAGLAGRPCWHAAAVFVAKAEATGVRVTGPAAREEALPANVTPLPAGGLRHSGRRVLSHPPP